ncbi:hypothetical protein SISSUDRAFT_835623 [Sistotremastrum suecicum HHB10207 ss-3]|uniref:Uncharacterized protein n=1 Tax=Sistotremastrum suecicum HHB10207 ss-3 TaxID=1314776 RepID=A0A166CK48_9AGAM|nr:hypothetical protein SISSUDRAFT_835623 [Sistotremastrum suecicum HHB10207 ss-3]
MMMMVVLTGFNRNQNCSAESCTLIYQKGTQYSVSLQHMGSCTMCPSFTGSVKFSKSPKAILTGTHNKRSQHRALDTEELHSLYGPPEFHFPSRCTIRFPPSQCTSFLRSELGVRVPRAHALDNVAFPTRYGMACYFVHMRVVAETLGHLFVLDNKIRT